MKTFVAMLTVVVLATSAQPVFAQSRPDLPGSTQPVRLTSPRIAPLPESEWTDAHRALVREYAPDGRVGNGLTTLLHVPELAEAIMPFVTFLTQESALEPRDQALLLLRTAWVTHNQYLWSVFALNGRTAGLTDADLRRIAVGPDADGWTDFEAAHLKLADELYRNSSVTDRTWTTLGVRYNLQQMAEAVMNVNEFTLLSMMFNAMGVQPNDWTTDRLPTGSRHSSTHGSRRSKGTGSESAGHFAVTHVSPRHGAVSPGLSFEGHHSRPTTERCSSCASVGTARPNTSGPSTSALWAGPETTDLSPCALPRGPAPMAGARCQSHCSSSPMSSIAMPWCRTKPGPPSPPSWTALLFLVVHGGDARCRRRDQCREDLWTGPPSRHGRPVHS